MAGEFNSFGGPTNIGINVDGTVYGYYSATNNSGVSQKYWLLRVTNVPAVGGLPAVNYSANAIATVANGGSFNMGLGRTNTTPILLLSAAVNGYYEYMVYAAPATAGPPFDTLRGQIAAGAPSKRIETNIVFLPPILSAEWISGTEIRLGFGKNWTTLSTQTVYIQLERRESTDGGATYGSWTEILEDADDHSALTYTDNASLTPGYYYQYRARIFVKISADRYRSSYSSITTVIPRYAAPTNVQVSVVSATSLRITWTDNANTETSQRIERSPAGAGTWTTVVDPAPDVTEYIDTGLTAETEYDYRVRADDGVTPTAWSATATARTAPNTPTGLTATVVNATTVRLSWTDTSSVETGFKFERSSDSGTTWTPLAATAAANATTYDDTTASPNTQYRYRAYAITATAQSAASVATADVTTPPSAPSGLTATAVDAGSIALTWVNTTTGATVIIERSAALGGPYSQIQETAANASSFTDVGLAADTVYYYRLRSKVGSTTSTPSSVSNVTTGPAAPTSLQASGAASATIALSWVDNSSTETEYSVERKIEGGAFAVLATLAAGVTAYLDGGLTRQPYTYRVRAKAGAVFSAYSNESTASPLLPAAYDLNSDRLTTTSHDLTWSYPDGFSPDGFRIERRLSTDSTFVAIDTVAGNVFTYEDTGLDDELEYVYRVFAYTDTEQSSPSEELSVGPLELAPSDLIIASTSGNSVTLSWTDNDTSEFGYEIHQSTDGGISYEAIGTTSANQNTYQVTGLVFGQEYHWKVRTFRVMAYGDGTLTGGKGWATAATEWAVDGVLIKAYGDGTETGGAGWTGNWILA